MTKYVLIQRTVPDEKSRVCVVNAGDEEEAKYKAKARYGIEWDVMEGYPTLSDIEAMVEDSPTETVLLNI